MTGCYTAPEPWRFDAELVVVDESGAPVADAQIDIGAATYTTDADGQASLRDLDGPVLAVIAAGGFLTEPVAVGRSDASRPVRVRLLSDKGGRRWVMHSGGDVMLGRRYQTPAQGQPLLPADDPGPAARALVAPLARAFAAADLRTINLETVLGDVPADSAYPGKEEVLHSRGQTVAALETLGVDLAVLANDHARDHLDQGIATTMATLEAAGIGHVGAWPGDVGAGSGEGAGGDSGAGAPFVFAHGSVNIGVLAWTTVDGSSVNDDYPLDEAPEPSPLPSADAWRYELRPWTFQGPTWSVLPQERRIGTAWRLFQEAEPGLAPDERRAAWSSLAQVYPELQDWVARRGHGGAALWDQPASTAAIQALRAEVDVLVVQLHAGFSGRDAPTAVLRQAARAAIDAGADIVIGHHPHVLQGAEWYKGHLIVYSLGNLIFDGDDRSAFPGAFLRTVWEDERLIEARLFLFELDGYRPLPITDAAARRTALALWERSRLSAEIGTDNQGRVRLFLTELDPDTQPASIRMRHHDALIEPAAADPGLPAPGAPAPGVDDIVMDLPAGQIASLGYTGLILRPAPGQDGAELDDIWLGRDLLGWGSFEDQLADGARRQDTGWRVNSSYEEIVIDDQAETGIGYVRVRRTSSNTQSVQVEQVGRMALPEHRMYRNQAGTALSADGEARYSLRVRARMEGEGIPSIHFDLHHPRRGEARADLPLVVPADGQWHLLEVSIPKAVLSFPGTRTQDPTPAAEVGLAVRLLPPERGSAQLDVDDLAFIEWRQASKLPDRFGAYDLVYNDGQSAQRLILAGLPLEPAPPPATATSITASGSSL